MELLNTAFQLCLPESEREALRDLELQTRSARFQDVQLVLRPDYGLGSLCAEAFNGGECHQYCGARDFPCPFAK